MAHNSISARGAILIALTHGEGFGLELIERVKRMTRGKVVLTQASVYPELLKLKEEGLASSREVIEPRRGGRPKCVYKLTRKGSRAANEERRAILGLVKEGNQS